MHGEPLYRSDPSAICLADYLLALDKEKIFIDRKVLHPDEMNSNKTYIEKWLENSLIFPLSPHTGYTGHWYNPPVKYYGLVGKMGHKLIIKMNSFEQYQAFNNKFPTAELLNSHINSIKSQAEMKYNPPSLITATFYNYEPMGKDSYTQGIFEAFNADKTYPKPESSHNYYADF